MIDFVQRNFRKWFPVILWVILIGCIISGLITGWNTSRVLRFPPFIGAILGGGLIGLIGLIFIVLVGGIFATILKMADDLEQLKNKIGPSNNMKNNTLPAANSTSPAANYAPKANPVSGDSWVCKKCGEKNRLTSSSCKGCGEYR
jgi:hypothetical protein